MEHLKGITRGPAIQHGTGRVDRVRVRIFADGSASIVMKDAVRWQSSGDKDGGPYCCVGGRLRDWRIVKITDVTQEDDDVTITLQVTKDV